MKTERVNQRKGRTEAGNEQRKADEQSGKRHLCGQRCQRCGCQQVERREEPVQRHVAIGQHAPQEWKNQQRGRGGRENLADTAIV